MIRIRMMYPSLSEGMQLLLVKSSAFFRTFLQRLHKYLHLLLDGGGRLINHNCRTCSSNGKIPCHIPSCNTAQLSFHGKNVSCRKYVRTEMPYRCSPQAKSLFPGSLYWRTRNILCRQAVLSCWYEYPIDSLCGGFFIFIPPPSATLGRKGGDDNDQASVLSGKSS
jgi:hypothetical protein